MTLTPQDFVSKWKRVTAREKQIYQEHFIDLCHLAGHQTPMEYDPSGTRFGFEMGAAKTSGGQGWADVAKHGCFGWEYKGKAIPTRADGRPPLQRKSRSLGSFIAGFKSSVTRRLREELGEPGFWQRNYYACPERSRRERIIRNDKELDAIYRYIQANPANWEQDQENPTYIQKEPK